MSSTVLPVVGRLSTDIFLYVVLLLSKKEEGKQVEVRNLVCTLEDL